MTNLVGHSLELDPQALAKDEQVRDLLVGLFMQIDALCRHIVTAAAQDYNKRVDAFLASDVGKKEVSLSDFWIRFSKYYSVLAVYMVLTFPYPPTATRDTFGSLTTAMDGTTSQSKPH